jgi:hypothetical protein
MEYDKNADIDPQQRLVLQHTVYRENNNILSYDIETYVSIYIS